MIIRMLRTALGADDGYTVRTYDAGREYEVGSDLAREFLNSGVAVEAAAAPQGGDDDPAEPAPARAKKGAKSRR